MLPRDRWIGNTECIEILESYSFPSMGGTAAISGGVSLGGLKTFKESPTISRSLTPALRRGGLDYTSSSLDQLKTWKGTIYNLPAETPGRVVMIPGEKARLRGAAEAMEDEGRVLRPNELDVGRIARSSSGHSDGRSSITRSTGSVSRTRAATAPGAFTTTAEPAQRQTAKSDASLPA